MTVIPTSRREPVSVEEVLSRLQSVRRTGEGRWAARCPAHGDKGPSLSVRAGDDGRVLLHDFGGCSFPEIVEALGLRPEQLFPPSNTPWHPTWPRRDPDRAAREWAQRLRQLHVPTGPARYRRELAWTGRLLGSGTRAPGKWRTFDTSLLQVFGLRVIWQAAQALAKQGTPRRWFSPHAIAQEVDRVAGHPGRAREMGLYRLCRLAVRIARRDGEFEKAYP
jgi:hypothetical protein